MVVDGNLVTSRKPDEFNQEMIGLFEKATGKGRHAA